MRIHHRSLAVLIVAIVALAQPLPSSDLHAAAAERDGLPPGLQKKDKLPPGWQKKNAARKGVREEEAVVSTVTNPPPVSTKAPVTPPALPAPTPPKAPTTPPPALPPTDSAKVPPAGQPPVVPPPPAGTPSSVPPGSVGAATNTAGVSKPGPTRSLTREQRENLARMDKALADLEIQAARPGASERLLQRLSNRQNVPIATLQSQLKANPGLTVPQLYVATILAHEGKTPVDQVLRQHRAGTSWADLAATHKVTYSEMAERLRGAEQAAKDAADAKAATARRSAPAKSK